MCNFFSFITEPEYHGGKRFYFDWKYRNKHLNLKENSYAHDSHSSICYYYNLEEDVCNKYEYNPLTKEFKIDQMNSNVDDRVQAEEWVRELNFKKIVKPLIIKDVVNPLTNLPEYKDHINDKIIMLLKDWNSVQPSITRHIDESMIEYVGNTPKDMTYKLVARSMSLIMSLDKYNHEVATSITSARMAYMGSFFDIPYRVNIESLNKLWNMGLLPSFDGIFWRLHSGENANIVAKISRNDLRNFNVAHSHYRY